MNALGEERAAGGHGHREAVHWSSKIRMANATRHPCSPGERSDPGDSGDKTNGYSIWLTPPRISLRSSGLQGLRSSQRAAFIERSTASLGQQSTLRPADF